MTFHIAPSSVWSLVRGRGGHWCPKRLTNDAYKTLFQLKEYHLLQVTFYYYLTVHSSSCSSWKILYDLNWSKSIRIRGYKSACLSLKYMSHEATAGSSATRVIKWGKPHTTNCWPGYRFIASSVRFTSLDDSGFRYLRQLIHVMCHFRICSFMLRQSFWVQLRIPIKHWEGSENLIYFVSSSWSKVKNKNFLEQ